MPWWRGIIEIMRWLTHEDKYSTFLREVIAIVLVNEQSVITGRETSIYNQAKGFQALIGEGKTPSLQAIYALLAQVCLQKEAGKLKLSVKPASKERHLYNIEKLKQDKSASLYDLIQLFTFYRHYNKTSSAPYLHDNLPNRSELFIDKMPISANDIRRLEAEQLLLFERFSRKIRDLSDEVPEVFSKLNQAKAYQSTIAHVKSSMQQVKRSLYAMEDKQYSKFNLVRTMRNGACLYIHAPFAAADQTAQSASDEAFVYALDVGLDAGRKVRVNLDKAERLGDRSVIAAIGMDDQGELTLQLPIEQIRRGQSSRCLPFYHLEEKKIQAHVWTMMSEKVQRYEWLGDNLHEASAKDFVMMVKESDGIQSFIQSLTQSIIQTDAAVVNGDFKLDNILWHPLDKQIHVIDNCYDIAESPCILFTGLLWSKVDSLGWFDAHNKNQSGNDPSVSPQASMLSAWLATHVKPLTELSSQTMDYQDAYTHALVEELRGYQQVSVDPEDKFIDDLGEALLLAKLRYNRSETFHDAFALLTVIIQCCDRYQPSESE